MESVVIGGPGIIVEIDETKLGKRKYNRVHRVEGILVVAGVERTPERKIFLCEVENRSVMTIKEIFQTNVLPGSIIFTDFWASYFQSVKNWVLNIVL